MSEYYFPDITGTNSLYLRSNIPYVIYKTGIKIRFETSPIFQSSLVIKFTDGTGTLLVHGVDWVVNDDDVDTTAMSRAFIENPNFTETLIRSITVTSSIAVGKQVAMTFQQFYLTVPGLAYDDGTPLQLTPDLIKYLVAGVADSRQQLAKVTSPVAPVNATPKLLPLDINKALSGNVITGEAVAVNTAVGATVIRLTEGPYFADSLVLTYNGATLNPTTDYLPIGLSAAMTQQSTNKGGIYRYILITATVTGSVTATYHALGGEVQPQDVHSVFDLMTGIQTYLNNGVFVTKDTISQTTAFQSLYARTLNLEDSVRNLLSGQPTYSDATAGQSVVRPIRSVDANFHWFTIASLYQVVGSTDIILADRFKGRVYFPGAQVSMTFSVDVNLNNTRRPVSFSTESLVFDPLYTLFSSVSANAPVYPMLRVVWNQASQAFSGAMVQIGLPLTALTDTMTVEDLSTVESGWLLDKSGVLISGQTIDPTQPSDDGFVLPDGLSFWSSVSNVSFFETHVPVYQPGYLVYSGSNVTLDQLDTQASTGGLFNVVLPTYFPTALITAVTVTLLSEDGNTPYTVSIPMASVLSGTMTGQISFADTQGNISELSAQLVQDALGNISMSLNTSTIQLSTGTGDNTPTDVVRYIRVQV